MNFSHSSRIRDAAWWTKTCHQEFITAIQNLVQDDQEKNSMKNIAATENKNLGWSKADRTR